MTEQSPIAKIFSEIASADKATKRSIRIEEERKIKSEELFKQSMRVLEDCGEERQKNVGRGAGRGIIGYRLGTESYLETPPAPVKFRGRKVDLVLAEGFSSYPGYQVEKDRILLTAKFGASPNNEQNIFSIDKDGEAQNWLGKPATIEQMDLIGEVLSLIKDSLPIIDRSKSQNLGFVLKNLSLKKS